MSAATMGTHRARITLASLMGRLTGLEDARGLPMPSSATNIEQLRDQVETIEGKRVEEAGGYEPRHRFDWTEAQSRGQHFSELAAQLCPGDDSGPCALPCGHTESVGSAHVPAPWRGTAEPDDRPLVSGGRW